jgi:hypothetical protein
MGFYFRKSVSIGPVRLNFSNSGIGTSFGIKGLRYGVRPDGRRYVHAGRYGVYYRQDLDGHTRRSITQSVQASEPTVTFDTASASQLAKTSPSRLQELIESAYNKPRLDYIVGLIAVFGSLLLAFVGWFPAVLFAACGALAAVYFAWWESRRRTIYLHYEQDHVARVLSDIGSGFNQLAACQGVWSIMDSRELYSNHERKRNAGVGSLVNRRRLSLGQGTIPWVEANVPIPTIGNAGQTLYFLPDGMVVYDHSGIAQVSYTDLQVRASSTRFVEEQPPSDATIVGHTWLHPNKDGGPDARFASNRQLAICEYGQCSFASRSGLHLLLEASRANAVMEFDRAIQNACAAVGAMKKAEEVLPAVAVNPEHFQTGVDVARSIITGTAKALNHLVELVDLTLGRIAGEGNDILHWFLRVLVAVGVAAVLVIVALQFV